MNWEELSIEEKVELLVRAGMSESNARLIVAIGSGELDGDVVEGDRNGDSRP